MTNTEQLKQQVQQYIDEMPKTIASSLMRSLLDEVERLEGLFETYEVMVQRQAEKNRSQKETIAALEQKVATLEQHLGAVTSAQITTVELATALSVQRVKELEEAADVDAQRIHLFDEENESLRNRIAELERENEQLQIFQDKMMGQSAEIIQHTERERCISVLIDLKTFGGNPKCTAHNKTLDEAISAIRAEYPTTKEAKECNSGPAIRPLSS